MLEAYLRRLPREFSYAVEVRHPDFFDGGSAERAFDALLGQLGMDRVIFDPRGLHASVATDEATLEAKRKKPRVPARTTATGPRPFVRFVGDPVIEKNDAGLQGWAAVVARWLAEGRTPFFFTMASGAGTGGAGAIEVVLEETKVENLHFRRSLGLPTSGLSRFRGACRRFFPPCVG